MSARGIEMGHIFQLGRLYAQALGLQVLDENGKLVTVTMGSYGIGPSRAVAAIAENTLDELGLCWPRAVAPADVHIVAAGKDGAVFSAAEQLAGDLSARGLTVMYDDRKASPGVKFKDAELIGVPTIVTVGRGLADGLFEVKDRASGERTDVPVADAVDHLAALVRSSPLSVPSATSGRCCSSAGASCWGWASGCCSPQTSGPTATRRSSTGSPWRLASASGWSTWWSGRPGRAGRHPGRPARARHDRRRSSGRCRHLGPALLVEHPGQPRRPLGAPGAGLPRPGGRHRGVPRQQHRCRTGRGGRPGLGPARPFKWSYSLVQGGGALGGYLLGATVGVGTVAVVLALGPLVDLFSRLMRLDVHQT